MANQLAYQRHARGRSTYHNRVGTGIGRDDRTGEDAGIDDLVMLRVQGHDRQGRRGSRDVVVRGSFSFTIDGLLENGSQFFGNGVVQRNDFDLVLSSDLLHIEIVDQPRDFDHVARRGADDQ